METYSEFDFLAFKPRFDVRNEKLELIDNKMRKKDDFAQLEQNLHFSSHQTISTKKIWYISLDFLYIKLATSLKRIIR